MTYIPGWPSLTPVDTAGEKTPYPSSISDFDDAISQYANLVEDARAQIRRNLDAERLEKKEIDEERRYIARQNRMLAERARKGLKKPPETEGNIQNALECIERCEEVRGMLPAHRDSWRAELDALKNELSRMREERRQGLGSKGQVRDCNALTTVPGQRCQNPIHFRKGEGWGKCPTHYP